MNAKIEEALKNLNLNNEDLQKVRGIMIEEKVERVMRDLERASKRARFSSFNIFCPCCLKYFTREINDTLEHNEVDVAKFARYLRSKGCNATGDPETLYITHFDTKQFERTISDTLKDVDTEEYEQKRVETFRAEFIAAIRAGLE